MFYRGKKVKSIRAYPNPKTKSNLFDFEQDTPYLSIKFAGEKTRHTIKGKVNLDDFTFK